MVLSITAIVAPCTVWLSTHCRIVLRTSFSHSMNVTTIPSISYAIAICTIIALQHIVVSRWSGPGACGCLVRNDESKYVLQKNYDRYVCVVVSTIVLYLTWAINFVTSIPAIIFSVTSWTRMNADAIIASELVRLTF